MLDLLYVLIILINQCDYNNNAIVLLIYKLLYFTPLLSRTFHIGLLLSYFRSRLHYKQISKWFVFKMSLMVEHTLSQLWGVSWQLSPTNTEFPFINLRLCAVIKDGEQQIGTEPDYHSMLQTSQWVSLWRWERCLFWRCHSRPYQHPPEHHLHPCTPH